MTALLTSPRAIARHKKEINLLPTKGSEATKPRCGPTSQSSPAEARGSQQSDSTDVPERCCVSS